MPIVSRLTKVAVSGGRRAKPSVPFIPDGRIERMMGLERRRYCGLATARHSEDCQ
jgi:hypothetical protein